jgi:hypothetical protein
MTVIGLCKTVHNSLAVLSVPDVMVGEPSSRAREDRVTGRVKTFPGPGKSSCLLSAAHESTLMFILGSGGRASYLLKSRSGSKNCSPSANLTVLISSLGLLSLAKQGRNLTFIWGFPSVRSPDECSHIQSYVSIEKHCCYFHVHGREYSGSRENSNLSC